MAKGLFLGCLTIWLVTAATVGVRADVTGAFTLDITMIPQTNSQEAIGFFFDLQSNLRTNVTISGLTFAFDLGFGNTGVEFAVFGINTNLGALSLADQFVFAVPFGCATSSWLGVAGGFSDDTDGGLVGQCPPQFVSPVGSSDGLSADGAIAFVKKRVDLALDIAGITLDLLALFEDVDFPDIQGAQSALLLGSPAGSDHEHDHFRPGDLYFVGQSDNVVDNQTPSFGFGAVWTVSGQTVSGISVTNVVGVCADNQVKNRLKKRAFPGEVDASCVSETGPVFAFTVEKIHVEGVELSGLVLSSWLEFRPFQSPSTTIEVAFSLAGLADVKAQFQSDNVLSLLIDSITIELVADNFTLLLEDADADLQIDRSTASFNVTLNPNQNPARFSSVSVTERPLGLVSQTVSLSVTRTGLTIGLLAQFLHDGAGLSWDHSSFSLSAQANVITFGAEVIFSTRGLDQGTLSFSVNF